MSERTSIACLKLLSLIIVAMLAASVASAQDPGRTYEPGEIIIKFREGSPAAAIQGVKSALPGRTRSVFRSTGAECIELEDMTVAEAIERFRNDPAVEYVEPNYIWTIDAVPDDPQFDLLWGMRNTGQTGGTPGADISMESVWDVHQGSRDVLVAVIDTGIDYNHPDLAANIWTNPGEIPGNGLDDDGNGYVDDIHGYDFAYRDSDPMDIHSHGTHCAGTIGAVGDNGMGVAGVNWNVSLMAVKFLDDHGSGSNENAILAVEYATAMGADITSNSWGGGSYSDALLDAIEAAGDAGILFVAAAGNSSQDIDHYPHYPCGYPAWNIISVASTDHGDRRSSFSNWGLAGVDLAAPGSDIYSTVPGGGYSSKSGTSMACPHVAGAAALLQGQFPGLTAEVTKELLLDSVDPIPAMDGLVATGGRLNVAMALIGPDEIPPDPVVDLAVTAAGSDWLELGWTATGDDGSEGTATFTDVRYSLDPITAENFDAATPAPMSPAPAPAGSAESFRATGLEFETGYHLALQVRDDFGNPSGISNVVTGTTLGAPVMSGLPASLEADISTGATATRTMTISNPSTGVLDFTIPDPVCDLPTEVVIHESLPLGKGEFDPRVGDDVVVDAGGPDQHGYRWVDSDEPSGPVFDWVEISATGTRAITVGDDITTGSVSLGFQFPFYGEVFESLHICTNGWVSPTSASRDFTNQPLPSPGAPSYLIAPFWDDLAVGGSVLYQREADRFIVQWNDVYHFGSGGPYTFQVIIHADGRILFQYLSMAEPLTSATVGIQNNDGTDGLLTAFNTLYAVNGLAVSFYELPSWLAVEPRTGSVPPGGSADVEVRFDAAGLCGGDYLGAITVFSNDPAISEAEVPAFMTVTAEPDILVTPAAFGPREYFTGVDHTEVLRVASPGCGVLNVASVSSDHPSVAVDGGPFELLRGDYVDLPVAIRHETEERILATITVTSDDPDEPVISIPVEFDFLSPPRISPSDAAVVVTAGTGEIGATTLGVGNTGGSDLEWSATEALAEGLVAFADPAAEEVTETAVTTTTKGEAASNSQREAEPGFDKRVVRGANACAGLERILLLARGPDNVDRLLYDRALSRLGLSRTVVTSWPVLEKVLGDGTAWDLVMVDSYVDSPSPTVLDALADHVDRGGRLLLGDWAASTYGDHRLLEAMDVVVTGESVRPGELKALEEGAVPMAPTDDQGHVEAAVVAPGERAAALRTYTDGSPAALINGAGTTICNAFQAVNYLADLDGDGDPDIVDLLMDQVVRLAPAATWLEFDPAAGTTPAGGSVEIRLDYDATTLCGGVYRTGLVMASNDPFTPSVLVPVTLAVTGEPDVAAPDSVDLGTAYVDWTKSVTVEILNAGCDLLTVSEVTVDDPVFAVGSWEPYVGPGDVLAVEVLYSPTTAGPSAGTLTVRHNDPDDPMSEIALTGLGVLPPVLDLDADDMNVALVTGEVATRGIRLANTGGTDLDFAVTEDFATYAELFSRDAVVTATDTPRDPAVVDPVPANGDGPPPEFDLRVCASDFAPTDLEHVLVLEGGVYNNYFYSVALTNLGIGHQLTTSITSFSERFNDGTPWDLVIVNLYTQRPGTSVLNGLADFVAGDGRLILADWSVFEYAGHELLALLGVVYRSDFVIPMNFVAIDPEHPVFSFPNRVTELDWTHNQANRDGQIVGVRDGAQALAAFANRPDDTAMVLGPTRRTIFNGFQSVNYQADADVDGVLDMVELLENEIVYLAGNPDWLRIEPESGTLPPGGSAEVVVTFDATNLCTVAHEGVLDLTTNDPVSPLERFSASLNVTGSPAMAVAPDSLEFGTVFMGMARVDTLTISNVGCDDLEVTDITSSHVAFSATPSSVVVPAGSSSVVRVTFAPDVADTATAVLTVASNDPRLPEVEVLVAGRGAEPPVVGVAPDSLLITGFPDEVVERQIIVSNSGDSRLDFSTVVAESAPAGTDIGAEGYYDLDGRALVMEGAHAAPGYYAMAARELGLTTQVVTTQNALIAALRDGSTWDVVLVNNTVGYLGYAALTDLMRYMERGGRIIMYDYQMQTSINHPIYRSVGVSFARYVYEAESIYPVELHHPCFRFPYDTGPWHATDDQYSVAGSLMRAEEGATRLATWAQQGFASIALGRQEAVIVNGFPVTNYEDDADGDGLVDVVELIANEIFFLVGDGPEIVVDPASGSVPPGEELAVTVRADLPAVCGLETTRNVLILSNDPVTPRTSVHLALETGGGPGLSGAPDSLAFGTVFVGTSRRDTVTIRNLGCETLTGFCVPSNDLLIDVEPATFDLENADSVAVTVTYSPLEAEDMSSFVVIVNNDPDQPAFTVSVSGAGALPPVAVVTSDTLDVVGLEGDVFMRSLEVRNDGAVDLDWSASLSASVSGITDWLQLSPDAGVVEPGGAVVLEASFILPDQCGFREEGAIVFATNDPLRGEIVLPASAEVRGRSRLEVRPDSVRMSPVFVDLTATSILDVVNSGCTVLTITDIVSDDPALTVSPASFEVPAGGEQAVEIAYTTSSLGSFAASLTVLGDDPDTPELAVPVTGEARLAPHAEVDPDSIIVSALTIDPGVPVVRRFTLSNTGLGELVWEARDRYLSTEEAQERDLVTTDPPKILMYEERGFTYHYEAALERAGLPCSHHINWVTLSSDFRTNGPWDLVVVNARQPTYVASRLADLLSQLTAGGRLLLASPDMGDQHFEHPLGDALGAVFEAALTEPWNIGPADVASPIFSEPNQVDGLLWHERRTADMGQFLAADPTAEVLAEFDDGGRHPAVIGGSGGRAIFNAFHAPDYGDDDDGDGIVDMVEFLENEMTLLAGEAGLLWLDIEPDRGVLPAGGSVELTVTMNLPRTTNVNYAGLVEIHSNDPESGVLPVTVSVRTGTLSSGTRTLAAGWSLVGPPLQPAPGAGSLQQVVLARAPASASCFSHAGDAGYVLLDRTSQVGPGDGMWVTSTEPFDLTMSGTLGTEGLSIPLGVGWNLVGHPTPDRGPLAGIQIDHGGRRLSFAEAADEGLLGGFVFGYDSDAQAYALADVLQAWNAYWFLAHDEGVSLWYPPGYVDAASPVMASATVRLESTSWSLELGVDGASALARIGAREGCGDGYDEGFDLRLPPPAPESGDALRIVLHRPDWGGASDAFFATDYRGTGNQPRFWDLEIDGPAGDHLLRWRTTGLPAELDLQLFDRQRGEVVVTSLREQPEFAFTKGEGPVLLQVRTPDYAPELAWLEEGLRLRNSPNPFNPSTRFEFNLPRDGTVMLRIYDVRGAVVRSLRGGAMVRGPRALEWQGHDDDGGRVASGVYFYRLNLDGKSLGSTRKMTLLK